MRDVLPRRLGTCETKWVSATVATTLLQATCATSAGTRGATTRWSAWSNVPRTSSSSSGLRSFGGVTTCWVARCPRSMASDPASCVSDELTKRIEPEGIEELIVATNPTVEGDATAMYIAREFKPLGLRVTRLASGLPVGGDLDYADELTLGRALLGRSEL